MLFRQNANLKLVSLAAVIWVSPNALRDIQKTAARETNLKHASKLSLFPCILFTMLQMARSVESFLKSYDICQKKNILLVLKLL